VGSIQQYSAAAGHLGVRQTVAAVAMQYQQCAELAHALLHFAGQQAVEFT
jgi:hypothetical protein